MRTPFSSRFAGLATLAAVLGAGGPGCDARVEPPPPRARAREPAPAPESAPEPESESAPEPWSDAWLAAEATRYLDDPGFRRAMLEASLTNPDNQYSRKRLAAYARADQGWDGLPEWVPAVTSITSTRVERLRQTGELALDPKSAPVWDGQRPQTYAAWVELGARVFYDYPLRPEIFARHALANPELAAQVGLRPDADARWPGVVAFRDLDGRTRVGITCALCHVGEDASGELVPGRARRTFDYGQMRLAFYRDTGAPLSPVLAARMARWGPGRADITDDDDEDPVAIPDLWGLRDARHLTQAATLTHEHPASLAIRQETQLLHANRERARPPRELAWALAMFVYSLEPPAARASPAPADGGEALFEDNCRPCHARSNGSGDPIPAAEVGTDPALAFGRARGTGLLRPSPLIRVADAAPYLHDGSVVSLEHLLGRARFESDFGGGARGPGPIAGHAFGTELSGPDRRALISYLRTL